MTLRPALLLAPPALLLAAGIAAQPAPETVDVRAAMRDHVNPATLAIWDVGNNAMDDQGGIDANLMDEERWAQLATAATSLDHAAQAMNNAKTIISAAAENQPEEAPAGASMQQIQAYIDADPDGFRAAAKGLADYAAELSNAALLRDAGEAGDIVARLDGVCEACHSQFWYPEG